MHIRLVTEHIPGSCNVHADFLSRSYNDNIEWSIKDSYFNSISSMFFTPSFDLFAADHNTKCSAFYSYFPELHSSGEDAFYFFWIEKAYAFPPFNVIHKVLGKVYFDQLQDFILICPFWPAQSWFPTLVKMLVETPIVFSADGLFLSYRPYHRHPLYRHLPLVGCRISSNSSRVEAFHNRLQRQLSLASHQVRLDSTNLHSSNGLFSVLNGIMIPYCQI
jgi:hypothetical protein